MGFTIEDEVIRLNNDITKLQEDIFKSDIKKVEKLWKAMDENSSLEYHLNRMTKDELVKIGSKYGVRGITSLKKADAVAKVKEGIINNIDRVLELLDEDAIEYIDELISLDGVKKYTCNELINANYFRNRGLMFTGISEETLNVILPEEVYQIIKDKLDGKLREKARKNSEIINLFAGMIYFYGVLSIDKFKSLVTEYIEYSLKDINVEAIIEDGVELGFDYQINSGLGYHIDVDDEVEILSLQQKEKGVEYYKFDKKALLKASSPDFIEENKQASKLEKVIGQLFVIDKNILKEEVDSFSIAIKNELPLEDAINTFLEAYEIESENEKNIFTIELTKLAKSIKRWVLKGYTQVELDNKNKSNEEKVGRNNPCPCGSKKKYKKCCGR